MSQPSLYNTYDLTVGVIVDMENMIHLLDPVDVPLQAMNGADGRSALTTGTCFEKKVEWLDEELLLPKSTLAAQLGGATTGSTVVTVASGHRARFSTGDVLAIEDERVRVASYGATTDTLIVTRSFASSTLATHASAAAVLILGQALQEGSDPEAPRAVDRTARYNVTQIFGPTSVRVSGTENIVRKYGLSGTEFDKQVANRTKEQYIQIEHAILYSAISEGDSTNDYRTMSGFEQYITTNVNTTTTSLTETALLDQIQNTWDVGGRVDRALVGATQKRRASAFTANLEIHTGRTDDGRGNVVEYFDSDFGRVSLLLDRWVKVNNLFLFDRDQASLETLRPMQFEMLAKTGDSIHGQVLCEKTLRFRRQRHAARFTALA